MCEKEKRREENEITAKETSSTENKWKLRGDTQNGREQDYYYPVLDSLQMPSCLHVCLAG